MFSIAENDATMPKSILFAFVLTSPYARVKAYIQEGQTPFANCDAYIYVPSIAIKEWIINVQMPGWTDDGRIMVL